MMDKELKMKLLEQLMAEMDDSSMSKLSKSDSIMPEDGDMVAVKDVKMDMVPADKAPDMIKEKLVEAMKKDSEDDDMDEDMDEDMEDEDEYDGSSLMAKLKALKKKG